MSSMSSLHNIAGGQPVPGCHTRVISGVHDTRLSANGAWREKGPDQFLALRAARQSAQKTCLSCIFFKSSALPP